MSFINNPAVAATREKLILAAVNLFSNYGFTNTTTRMIANQANVSLSAISFHFQTKDNLYKATLEYAAEHISSAYDDIYFQIETLYGESFLDRNKAWDLICQLVDLQLYIAVDLPHKEFLTLLYWEQIYSPDGYCPITEVVYKKSEYALATLIQAYTGINNSQWAIVISRTINGSIISFGEHPVFIRKALNLTDEQAKLPAEIKNTIRNYTLNNIKRLAEDSVFL